MLNLFLFFHTAVTFVYYINMWIVKYNFLSPTSYLKAGSTKVNSLVLRFCFRNQKRHCGQSAAMPFVILILFFSVNELARIHSHYLDVTGNRLTFNSSTYYALTRHTSRYQSIAVYCSNSWVRCSPRYC